jgi:Putative metal-binding motif
MKIVACALGSILFASLVVSGCSGSDDAGLSGGSAPADAGDGAAGTSGTGGSGGSGGTAGVGGTGGTTGGSGGGSAGTAGVGGATGGTGGGGAAGAGGNCPGGCDDGVSCTVDSCVQDACVHSLGPCPEGEYCDLTAGCISGPVCADDGPCLQLWGNDACKTNIRCNAATATCTFDLLDKDGDDHAPLVCGGDDCDDSDGDRRPGLAEVCDGKDNDCDSAVDDGAACPGLLTCQAGTCACPPANTCGSECVDKNTDTDHCGACFHACPTVATCVGGTCDCPGSQTACGSICVDTQTDELNCGGCGQPCPAGATCDGGDCACPGNAATVCADSCVDLQSNDDHCGACGNACVHGSCQGGQCPACTPGGMLILMDVSGSMSTSSGGGQTRLQAQLSAVQTFVDEVDSDGLSVGVMYFPRQSGTSVVCDAPGYAAPDVPIDLLPGNAPAIAASMSGVSALGASVIIGPLGGGIGIVRGWEVAHPQRPGAVVMINDGGLKIGCSSETVANAVSVASAGFSATPPVRTHVVSVGTGSTNDDLAWWSQVPAAGGGALHETYETGYTAMLDALRTIRADLICP